MGSAKDKLDELAQTLEDQGSDPLRVEIVRRARRFKASWVEMAEGLLEVKRDEAFKRWGYEDFYAYCADELLLKRATVEKLTLSYNVLEKHAPEVLRRREDDSRPVPTCDAVDYFARALRSTGDEEEERSDEVIEELRHAVFDEGRGVASLRRHFNPILRPRAEHEAVLDAIERASAWIRKLSPMLTSLEAVPARRIEAASRALESARSELEGLRTELDRIREQDESQHRSMSA